MNARKNLPDSQKPFFKSVIAVERRLHEDSASAHLKIIDEHTQKAERDQKARRRWGASAIAGACATVGCLYGNSSLRLKVLNISSTLTALYQWRKARQESRNTFVPSSETLKALKAIDPFWNGYASQQEDWLEDVFYGTPSKLPSTIAERLSFIQALDDEWNPSSADCNKTLK